MNLADRIQVLRKSKNVSQEQLADQLGVSRQAVSKWESEQATPDINKIILLSDYFEVTTDYLLKGIEPLVDNQTSSNMITSKILYLSSTAVIAIGLLCAFGGWYSQQSMEVVWGSMIIQIVGIIGYYIGKTVSNQKPSSIIKWLNITLLAFMPISLLSGLFSITFLASGWIAPYPIGLIQIMVFSLMYVIFNIITYKIIYKK